MNDLHDVVAVEVLEGYRLRLRFDDGAQGEIDVARHAGFDGVFAPLKDPAFFRQVRVDSDLGTICWPNGADLAPEVLYEVAVGRRAVTR